MITLTENLITPMNGVVLLLTIFFAYAGFKRGFLRSLLSTIGTIASFYLAWILSDNMSLAFPLIQNSSTDEIIQQMSEQIYTFMNRVVWFFLLFLLFRVICFVLDLFLKSIHSIPGYRIISSTLGMLFGFVETIVWILLLCVLLESPLFKNGSLIVDGSILGTIKDIVVPVSKELFEPVIEMDGFSKTIDNIDSISEEKIQEFKVWLESEEMKYGD